MLRPAAAPPSEATLPPAPTVPASVSPTGPSASDRLSHCACTFFRQQPQRRFCQLTDPKALSIILDRQYPYAIMVFDFRDASSPCPPGSPSTSFTLIRPLESPFSPTV